VSDILIKNGWLFNGRSENILTKSDLLIHNGQIQAIGKIQSSRLGTKIINGEGRIVSPGFIDLNSQLDSDYRENKSLDDSLFLRQGITTAIIGSSGQSIFKHFLPPLPGKTKLETNLGSGNERERLLLSYNKDCPNFNLSSFLGWTTLNNWGIQNSLQLAILLNQIKNNFAGLSLEFRKENRDENLKQLNELVSVLSKRAKNLMLFFSNSLPDESLIKSLGQLSLNNQMSIVLDCPLLGCALDNDIILHLAEEENKKGANLVFKLWPYEVIQYELNEVNGLLGSKISGTKNLEKIVLSSPLFGSQVPQILRGKTLEEIKKNWNIDLKAALSKISILFPQCHFKILIPYHISEDWWDSSLSYVGVNSALVSADDIVGPNVFSGINHFLETHLAGAPADRWPQTLAKITSQPALIAGLTNRGFLQKDYLADIVIINPDKLKGIGDYQNPTSEGEGIETVIMNGQIVWQKGRVWKRKVGKLLI